LKEGKMLITDKRSQVLQSENPLVERIKNLKHLIIETGLDVREPEAIAYYFELLNEIERKMRRGRHSLGT
jgi:hypothetical protein